MESEFPSNSRNAQEKKTPSAKVEEKKVEKVVTGKVIRRKKSLGTKFKETFISGPEGKSVLEHMFFDILKPAAKDMFVDAAQSGLERAFYGEVRSVGRGRARGAIGNGYTAYNRIGSSPVVRSTGREDPRQQPSRRARAMHDFQEIILESRVEADVVLETLYELLSKFDVVTVADLYEAVDVESSFTDNRWGWEDLTGSGIQRVRANEYLLVLPRPIPID